MITDSAVCLRPARLWFWGCLCPCVKTEPNTAIWTQCKCCLSYYNVVYYKILQPLASPHHRSQLLIILFSTVPITGNHVYPESILLGHFQFSWCKLWANIQICKKWKYFAIFCIIATFATTVATTAAAAMFSKLFVLLMFCFGGRFDEW